MNRFELLTLTSYLKTSCFFPFYCYNLHLLILSNQLQLFITIYKCSYNILHCEKKKKSGIVISLDEFSLKLVSSNRKHFSTVANQLQLHHQVRRYGISHSSWNGDNFYTTMLHDIELHNYRCTHHYLDLSC